MNFLVKNREVKLLVPVEFKFKKYSKLVQQYLQRYDESEPMVLPDRFTNVHFAIFKEILEHIDSRQYIEGNFDPQIIRGFEYAPVAAILEYFNMNSSFNYLIEPPPVRTYTVSMSRHYEYAINRSETYVLGVFYNSKMAYDVLRHAVVEQRSFMNNTNIDWLDEHTLTGVPPEDVEIYTNYSDDTIFVDTNRQSDRHEVLLNMTFIEWRTRKPCLEFLISVTYSNDIELIHPQTNYDWVPTITVKPPSKIRKTKPKLSAPEVAPDNSVEEVPLHTTTAPTITHIYTDLSGGGEIAHSKSDSTEVVSDYLYT